MLDAQRRAVLNLGAVICGFLALESRSHRAGLCLLAASRLAADMGPQQRARHGSARLAVAPHLVAEQAAGNAADRAIEA
jgi:hypothetical protein